MFFSLTVAAARLPDAPALPLWVGNNTPRAFCGRAGHLSQGSVMRVLSLSGFHLPTFLHA